MRRALIVFVGGGCGSVLRAVILAWLAPWNTVMPLPVLLVNVLGSFALGVVFVLADEAALLNAETRLFLAVGMLGGFTTFSTFGWGADLLLAHGADGAALVYLAASVVGGVVAVSAGMVAGREAVALLARWSERRLGIARPWVEGAAGAVRVEQVSPETKDGEESA